MPLEVENNLLRVELAEMQKELAILKQKQSSLTAKQGSSLTAKQGTSTQERPIPGKEKEKIVEKQQSLSDHHQDHHQDHNQADHSQKKKIRIIFNISKKNKYKHK